MYPWTAIDHSVVMAPPSYPFPVPMAMPPGSIPLHPHMQPYPFYGNQNPGVISNPCSTFVPYINPSTLVEQQSTQYLSPFVQHGSRSNASGEQDSRNKSSRESKIDKNEDSNNITTALELKTPGSASDQVSCRFFDLFQKMKKFLQPFWSNYQIHCGIILWLFFFQELSSGQAKSQKSAGAENTIMERSCSSRCSSSRSVQDSSSGSIASGRKAERWEREEDIKNRIKVGSRTLSVWNLHLLSLICANCFSLLSFCFRSSLPASVSKLFNLGRVFMLLLVDIKVEFLAGL